MKTKLLSLFVALICASSLSASYTEVDGIWYDFDSSTKTASVTYRGSSYTSYDNEYSGSVVIPETVTYNSTTYSVTTIGDHAFCNCEKLASVTIPNSVTTIEGGAFYGCSGLTSVTIGNSVTTIGGSAFEYCSSLTSVTIPSSVTTIGDKAFDGCSGLTSVTINSKSIVEKSYSYNNNIGKIFGTQVKEYIIGNSVTTIGDYAFYYCSGLTSVTIGNSVTSIGDAAFYGCSGLTSITIPNSVTTIGSSAFRNCYKLSSVTIPNSVTTIEGGAFYGCSGLTSVSIPNSVTTIGENAFRDCTNITSVIWNAKNCNSWNFGSQVESFVFGDKVEVIPRSLCSGMSKLKAITIPSSVTTIGEYAFPGCSGLTSVTIPNSVTTIGDHAFQNCNGLTSVTIGNSVTSIGDYAFEGCSNIKSVTWNAKNCNGSYFDYYDTYPFFGNQVEMFTFGDKVEVIPSSLCSGMSKLKTITIPKSVTTIGDKAFDGCSGLTSVTINSKSIVEKSYSYNNNIGKIFGTQVKEYIIGNSVTTIGDAAFYGCSGLTSITIPNSVTTIGSSAFRNCYKLSSVTIPNSVTTIGDLAFCGCSGLTSINVDAANTHYCSIDGILFNYAKDILMQYPAATTRTEYTIPNSVTTIGDAAFYGCKGLTSITIPNSVTEIGNEAFSYCSGLTSITIPNSVTTIGGAAFDGCTGLKGVYIINLAAWCKISFGNLTANPLYYAHNLYLNNELVMDLAIPSSVTTIGDYAFSGCSLSSITIPNSVKTIGDYAFYNCERISTITFGSGLWEIGDYAFSGDYRIADITCYAEVTPTIYAYTFKGITKKNVYLYVPENVIRRYQIDPNWNEFDIRTKSADIKPITGDQATVLPSANDAILTWPISNGAYTYTITITKGGETICLLTFNAQGQLQNIAFAAPGHDGAHQAPAATLTAQGYQFTVTGLNPGTAYNYSVTATDTGGETLAEYKGNFSTTGGTGFESVHGSQCTMHKYFHNGNLIIERNGIKYTATGQKVR